ncbi:MAG TPA: lytic transglycosylase domain-containing protein, partial [Gemmatimonadaceae bacterium]|nr:lytic transglycosylase domain-containing protein [Gemmatimonadaceae bacterium]
MSYVHRGDALRRRRRLTRLVLGVAGCMTFLVAYENQNPAEARAASAPTGPARPLAAASTELAATLGEVSLASDELETWHRIYSYSSRYGIGSQLARAIHDIAIEEGIEPELAFRLVRLESEFKPRATSSVGAIGLTQLMPATAR